MKFKYLIAFVYFCLYIVIFSIFLINIFLININAKELDSFNYCYSTLINEKEIYNKNDLIEFSFLFEKEISDDVNLKVIDNLDENIIKHYSTSKDNNKLLLVSVEFNDSAEKFKISLECDLIDNNIGIINIYSVRNKYGYFISHSSYDDAYYKSLDYLLKYNLIDINEYEKMFDEYNRNYIYESDEYTDNFQLMRGPIQPFVEFNGTIKWKDDNNVLHPLRKLLICLYYVNNNGNTLISQSYLNNSGSFNFSFDAMQFGSNISIMLRVYANDYNVYVKNSNFSNYYFDSSVYSGISNGDTLTRNIIIDMTSTIGQAMQISQSVITARDYAKDMLNDTPDYVYALYPYNTTNGFEYGVQNPYIEIKGVTSTNSGFVNYYASWDAIMHEYGHHIETIYDIDFCEGGPHVGTDNLADIKQDKEEGCLQAWSEAWCNVFSIVSQFYNQSYLTNIETTCNYYLEYGTFVSENRENTLTKKGEACENSVSGILWDVFDNNIESYDNLSLSYSGFWNCTVISGTYTLSDFVYNFYNSYPQYVNELASILNYFNVTCSTPEIINYNSLSNTIGPNISWNAQGGSISYPNNKFILKIYDENSNLLFTSNVIRDTIYSVNSSTWNYIVQGNISKIYINIYTYQDTDYETGPYISENSILYDVERRFNVSIYSSTRYYESSSYIAESKQAEYFVTFNTSGYKILQTFGVLDTKMSLYSSNDVLLYQDDDSGHSTNSLICFNATANTIYKIIVEFYDSNQAGNFRFSIIQTSFAYNQYENIYLMADNTYCYSSFVLQNNVDISRYKTNTSITKTFTIDSSFDSYLYLIDPTSTNLISNNASNPSVYNDDGAGNLQAEISKTLTANIDYLVIVSAFNPSIENGTYELYIN